MALATVWNQRLTGATVRQLTHADDELIYRFQAQHPAYFDRFLDHPVTKKEAIQDLDDLPVNAHPEQKAYLGVFEHDQLVLLVDLTLDYPLPSLVWLGLWLPAQQLSDQQVARYYQSLVQTLRAAGAVQLQLSVYMGDRQAPAFWQAQGLTAVQTATAMQGDRRANVTIYQHKF